MKLFTVVYVREGFKRCLRIPVFARNVIEAFEVFYADAPADFTWYEVFPGRV